MALELAWNDEQQSLPISEELIATLERLLKLAGEQEGVGEGEVALSFVDDEAIHELNKQYRGIDRPTDVLSFAMRETAGEEPNINYDELVDAEEDGLSDEEPEAYAEPLGDIIISVPRAIDQAREYGHSVERELGFLFVHGFLHLIGYDHGSSEEEQEMFGRQERILQKAGLSR